ncbi:hypothetical protein KCU88_g748, partial [Aureobasidium melanogenum]
MIIHTTTQLALISRKINNPRTGLYILRRDRDTRGRSDPIFRRNMRIAQQITRQLGDEVIGMRDAEVLARLPRHKGCQRHVPNHRRAAKVRVTEEVLHGSAAPEGDDDLVVRVVDGDEACRVGETDTERGLVCTWW